MKHRCESVMAALGVVALAWVLAGPVALSAATVVPIPLHTLVEESTTVVYGRVADVRGQWTEDRRGIESLVTLDGIEWLKGTAMGRVTFRTPGGTAGGRVQWMPGLPSFREGDLVLVFLRARGPAYPTIVGLSQGALRVTVSASTGTSMVVAPPVETADRAAGPIVRGDQRRRPVALAAFGRRVQALVEAGR